MYKRFVFACLAQFGKLVTSTSARGRFLAKEFSSFLTFFGWYFRKKTMVALLAFESQKNMLVRFLLMKRGRYNRVFLHTSALGVLAVGVMVAPIIADTYPVLGAEQDVLAASEQEEQSITLDENVFATEISQKPRDKVIAYKVERGDTVSTVAKKFGISTDTVRWTNDLSSDNLDVGQELKILPVTGMLHKVSKGDSVHTIAKKYDTEAQKIVDFPFNDFANPETFALVEGQLLVVPDGVKPSERPSVPRRQLYVAQGPVTISGSGFTWPLRGGVSQFASWYHMALDITSPVGTPVVAAHSGFVASVNVGTWDGGYGTNVIVSNGGHSSLYAHMSGVNVGVGDSVIAGKTVVGWVGLTGRTTGAHLHFEIRQNGSPIDPIPYLQ